MTVHHVVGTRPGTAQNRRLFWHVVFAGVMLLGCAASVESLFEMAAAEELPACPLGSVTITLPNETVTAANGESAWVTFLSEVAFDHSEACSEALVEVVYRVNGVVVATSDDIENGFPGMYQLPIGNYAVTATATVPGTGDTVSATHSFTVRDWPDLADCFTNPFACLVREGDHVTITIPTAACFRTVSMVTWFAEASTDKQGAYVGLAVENPANPDQVATASAPRALLAEGEQGVLLLAVSCDLDNLLEPGEAGLFAPPPDYFIAGGAYFEVSMLVRGQNDDAFAEIDSARLEAWPIRLSLDGLAFSGQRSPAFFAHPSQIDCDGQTGLHILAEAGEWRRDMVAAVTTEDETLRAETSSLSVFGPFEIPRAPTLEVTPDPTYDFIAGIVQVGSSRDSAFQVTNVGNSTLEGQAVLDDPEGVFSLVGASAYSLTERQSAAIVLRFAPREATEYVAALTFSGGYNGPFTVTLRGTGTWTKRVEFLGCGGRGAAVAARGPSTRSGRTADIVVVVLAALFLVVRLRAHRRGGVCGRSPRVDPA